MLIATWNLNSVRARLERLLAWLEEWRPDIVCLQEVKTPEANFPFAEIEKSGYHAAVFGQKGYHGVAILSRSEPQEISRGMADGVDDGQARLIAASIDGVRVMCAYAPNGGTPDSDKYLHKIAWFDRLLRHLRATENLAGPFLLCGDLNIAPEQRDVAHPERWQGTVLYNEHMSEIFGRLLACGLHDLGRNHLPAGTFSWWDYRLLSFPRNDGLRIDHLLASPALTGRCLEVFVDREQRKGKSPSDHAPVLARFS
ncbi:MAG: exodeoxyribonuclease III [Desulfuromonadales bacterium]